MNEKLCIKIQFLRVLIVIEVGVKSPENNSFSTSLIRMDFEPRYVLYDLESGLNAMGQGDASSNPGQKIFSL